MHNVVKNLIDTQKKIEYELSILNYKNLPKIIAVSKTFKIDKILPLIEHGHLDYGENKVQEAIDKWTEIKEKKPDIQLHMIGGLQTNKVKFAVKLFDYIHSVDSEKLARKIADEQLKIHRKIKIFIQVNIGDENQKSGINKNELNKLVSYCKKLDLNVIGFMCIPPEKTNPTIYFNEMNKLKKNYNFTELSMGMSSDYLKAAKNNATYLRIGSSIFGQRY
jgi:PLP dependent protein